MEAGPAPVAGAGSAREGYRPGRDIGRHGGPLKRKPAQPARLCSLQLERVPAHRRRE